MARESWTDDRLDDLSHRMDENFRAVRAEMKEGFDRADKDMKEGFDRVDKDIREMRAEISSLQRTMVQFGSVMVAALVGLIATQAGLILTQL